MLSFRCAAVCVLLLLSVGTVVPAAAQDTQVPVDQDSSVYSIEPALRDAAGLFPEVPGFEGAELYRVEEGGYELVIRYREQGRVRRERRSLTGGEVRELRAQVARALAARQDQRAFTQEGRYGLMAATTVHGLVEGGLLAGALGVEGGSAATLVLVGGASGFFVPLVATQGTRVTEGEADATFYGGLQGYAHAAEVTALLAADDPDGRATAGLAAVLGAAEGTAGYLTARRNEWTGGHAEMVTYTGLGGNAVGFGVGTALVGDDTGDDGSRTRVIGGTSLLGSLAGMYLGHRMGRTDRYTEGDARIYVQTAVQGANLMGSFLSVDEFPDARASSLLLTGSAVAGGLLGRRLVRDRDFTGTQGNLVALGSVAGSLLGLAVTLESEDEDATAIVQALGSAAGFGVTYGLLQGDARRQAASSASAFDLDVRVGPGLVRGPVGEGGETGLRDRLAPRVAVSASF